MSGKKDPVNVGVIGAGNIGRDHINRIAAASSARVVAIYDVDAGRAREIAAALAGSRTAKSGKDLISAPDVDAVLIASSGPTHEEYVLEALAARKPVFCEKPLSITSAGAWRVVSAESALGNRLVQVGFMRRYDAGYRALRKIVGDGTIGVPVMAHCAHRNPSVPGSYTSDMAITDTAIHELDILRWLLDDEISAVQAVPVRRTSRAADHLADPQIILLETEKGVRIDIEIFVNCQYGYDIQCELVGENGTARLPDPPAPVMRVSGQRWTNLGRDWRERFLGAYDMEIQAWIGSVRDGKATGPSAWDGYCAAVAADACLEAQRTSRIVAVSRKDRPSLYSAEESA